MDVITFAIEQLIRLAPDTVPVMGCIKYSAVIRKLFFICFSDIISFPDDVCRVAQIRYGVFGNICRIVCKNITDFRTSLEPVTNIAILIPEPRIPASQR